MHLLFTRIITWFNLQNHQIPVRVCVCWGGDGPKVLMQLLCKATLKFHAEQCIVEALIITLTRTSNMHLSA